MVAVFRHHIVATGVVHKAINLGENMVASCHLADCVPICFSLQVFRWKTQLLPMITVGLS